MQESSDREPPLLSLRGATVVRGGVPVLHDLNLEIAPGEHTAILGPNGSGKSSLIKLLTRECYPLARPQNEAAVQLFGQSTWNVEELRSLIGIVSSDLHHAFTRTGGGITGAEAVLSGAFGSLGLSPHQHVTNEMRTRARQALVAMDALPLTRKPLEAMSTGEARRVLIARALVSDPRALLLDEPTTGLDLLSTRRFLETIRAVSRRGKTLILVTHHVHEIVPEIERVILLREGSVFRDGPRAAVLTTETLSALYDAPIAVRTLPDGYQSADTVTGERK